MTKSEKMLEYVDEKANDPAFQTKHKINEKVFAIPMENSNATKAGADFSSSLSRGSGA